jgi:hypothetical protein
MEKGTSQFFRSAGRCEAMRHGVHAGMPLGCPLPACRGEITSFSKKPSFLGNHSKYVGKACSRRQRPRHAAKACIQGQGQGMLRRPRQPPWAGCEGQGMPPWHAAKAKARSQGHGKAGGHAGMPLGAGSSNALACTLPEGQWQHGEGVVCPVGGMPRPWHALGTPTRPWQHLGGLLLPSLDSLFGHLLLFPP